MPAVGLALGGRLRKRRAGVGADPPLLAWRRQAREVAVLHTLLSGRARLRSEVLARWVKPAGARTAQHLTSQINGWCFTHFPCCVTVTPINSFSTPPKTTEGTTSGSFTLLQSTLPSTHRQLLHSSSQRLLWGNWSPAWWQLFPTPTTAQTHRLTFWGLHPKPAPGWC